MRHPSTRWKPRALLISVLTAFGLLGPLGIAARAQVQDAGAVLADARTALGGETALTGVKTLVARGRIRQIRGNNTVPVELEITCQLPDVCVRREEYPAQPLEPTTTGFRGDTLIQTPPVTGPAAAARLISVQQEFARLLIGSFAGAVSVLPLTFSYAAEAEAPEGRADVLNVLGPSNFVSQLVVHRATHLPVMLTWRAPAATSPGPQPGGPRAAGPPPPTGSPAPQAPGPPAAVEHRLYFADYRSAGGVKWPFRLRRSIAGATIEETTFDSVRVNVPIDARKLEAGR